MRAESPLDKTAQTRSGSMAHPLHEDSLRRVREICAKLPEFWEKIAWEHPTFRAGKKMFAALGGETYGDFALGMKVGFERQEELLSEPLFFPTPYAAYQGWISMRITAKTDWKRVESLLREAYLQVANKRMVKALDALPVEAPPVVKSKGKPRKS